MGYYVYFLQSKKDNNFYIGCTSKKPIERLKEHNMGKMKSTKSRTPFMLIHFEEFDSKESAYKREWFLKQPVGYKEKMEIIRKFRGS